MIRALFFVTLAVAASFLHAGLVESQCRGRAEDVVVKEFEASLPKKLEPRLKDPAPPRITITIKKEEFYCQLDAIEGDAITWQTLQKAGLDQESKKPLWGALGPKHKLKVSELPPEGVGAWFDVARCDGELVVSVCAWLFSKKCGMAANAKLAQFAKLNATLRGEIEDYICAKNGWTKPASGLTQVDTVDLAEGVEGQLLLTPEAAAARLTELDKLSKTAQKELIAARGDTKGAFGSRSKAPTLPLAVIRDRLARYGKVFKGCPYAENARIVNEVKVLIENIDGDLKLITDNRYIAERKVIDEKFKEGAEIYESLSRGDPCNLELLQLTANAYYKAGGAKDGGNKCANPDAMKKSLTFYEALFKAMPRCLSYMNYLGVCHQCLGAKDKAKAFFNEVLRLGDRERDKGNRDWAETQLSHIR